jgi:hypothetical protein
MNSQKLYYLVKWVQKKKHTQIKLGPIDLIEYLSGVAVLIWACETIIGNLPAF